MSTLSNGIVLRMGNSEPSTSRLQYEKLKVRGGLGFWAQDGKENYLPSSLDNR